ncbi:MAG: hypothetical protein ACON5C_02550 [Alphaproteobacteria bacterium]|jgi:hypothetical protein
MLITFSRKRLRRGADLVNAMFYLVVAATVMAGASLAFQESIERHKQQNAVRQTLAMAEAVRNIFLVPPSQITTLGADLTNLLLQSNLVPQDMQSQTGLAHAFGGSVHVTQADGHIFLAFDNIPRDNCTRMALAIVDALEVKTTNGKSNLAPRTHKELIMEDCLADETTNLTWKLL